jgi:hypothetical protein
VRVEISIITSFKPLVPFVLLVPFVFCDSL